MVYTPSFVAECPRQRELSMSSIKRWKARPQSSYEPLLQSSEISKPKPLPKPPLKKSHSNAVMNKSDSSAKEASDATEKIGGGYFQSGGGSSIGYCLSSFYKVKVGPRVNDTTETSNKPLSNKPKFRSQDDSRPPLMSLPAKFQVSYQDRNQHGVRKTSESATPMLRTQSVSSVGKPPLPTPPPSPPEEVSPTLSNPSKSLPKLFSSPDFSTTSSTNSNEHLPIVRASSLSSHQPFRSLPSSSSNTSISLPSPIPSSPPAGARSVPVTYAQPPPREVVYTEREHPRNAFEYLNKLRHKGELCDAALYVNNKELKVHRVVLAACSQYFESVFIGEFAEPLGEPVVIEEVSDVALETIVEFAYTSHLNLTDRNVYSIFEAADFLQFLGVKGACFKFFKQQINKSNVIKTWLFAKNYNCTELVEAALRYVETNFVDIVRGKEFFLLDQYDVVCDMMSLEDLVITAEEQVYEATLAWIQYKMDKRKKYAPEVFKQVRFPSMSKDYLLFVVDHEPFIQENPTLLRMVSIP